MIVKLGENTGENDSAKLIRKASGLLENKDEEYIGFYDFNNYLDGDKSHTQFFSKQFAYDLLNPVIKHAERYFDANDFHFEDDSQLA